MATVLNEIGGDTYDTTIGLNLSETILNARQLRRNCYRGPSLIGRSTPTAGSSVNTP